MTDMLAAKRARMACRIYLKLFDAGPKGANIVAADAIGPRESDDADFPVAVDLLKRFVDDTILDEVSHDGGAPHYTLTPGMRARMEDTSNGSSTIAESIRSALAASDRGEDVPGGKFVQIEALIRTGFPGADSV